LAHELTHVVQQNGINAGNSIQREEGDSDQNNETDDSLLSDLPTPLKTQIDPLSKDRNLQLLPPVIPRIPMSETGNSTYVSSQFSFSRLPFLNFVIVPQMTTSDQRSQFGHLTGSDRFDLNSSVRLGSDKYYLDY